MNITKRISPNKNTGHRGWVPNMIACHITEGAYAGAVEWLCNPKSVASAHFVVARDGRITQLVELTDTAWCNGTSDDISKNTYYGLSSLAVVRERKVNANLYTISIEHEGFYTDGQGALTSAQLEATVELIAYIRSEVKRLFGINIPVDRQHIVGHCEITPKTKPNCPGQKYPFDEVIRRVSGETAVASSTTDTPTLRKGDTGDAVKRMQALFNAAGAELVMDGSFGLATEGAVKAFQVAQGLAVDGVCGAKTWAVLLGCQETAPELTAPARTPAEITMDNLLADGVINDPTYWLGVLGGTTQPNPEYIKTVFDRYHEKLVNR